MKLSEELQARGFVHQIAGDSLELIVDEGQRVVYHGIDPTADSAHAGNFVQWILLRHLANAGHKIIFLVGGGTGRIGDPKPDAERTLSDEATIDANVEKLKKQAEQLLGTSDVVFVNNNDWLGSIGMVEFLRDVGKHFTVNELVKKDAIAKRMNSDVGISYTEFAYPLLQAYDYLMLHRTYGCDLQTGGSDQWGNIVAGVDLVRRVEQKTVYALTQALVIDKTTGKKFGKSEGNAVWLDAEKTSPYQFYQFWLNTTDDNVIDFLKRFTFIDLEEIAAIEKNWQENPGARQAQTILADSITSFVHGDAAMQSVKKVSQILFGQGSLADLEEAEFATLLENAPVYEVTDGMTVVEALVASGLATSNREARTFIEGGAVELQGEKLTATDTSINSSSFTQGIAILKRGKKQLCVLKCN